MTIKGKLPKGFEAAGINSGIKNSKKDLGILVSDVPCSYAASLTTNKMRAHCVNRAASILQSREKIRAIIACSGNANALTGPAGAKDDQQMADALAQSLDILPDEILTASTGVIGTRLSAEKITKAIPIAMNVLEKTGSSFSDAILTTDTVRKIAEKEVFISGRHIRLQAITKGAGMIQPSMATMLSFIVTDANITSERLRESLQVAVDTTFNQITVDNDMSTNDMAIIMANGRAKNTLIDTHGNEHNLFTEALRSLLQEAAISIVRDGEGATRVLHVDIEGAKTLEDARELATGVAGGSLVKSAIFGADPYAWGRIMGALGAKAARINAEVDVGCTLLEIQDIVLFKDGAPVDIGSDIDKLRQRMKEPDIRVRIDLGQGEYKAPAWGCDLTYDYVKINADYASVTVPAADGSVSLNEKLGEFGPSIKKKVLIEALRYIKKFEGRRAVIKLGGAAMVDPKLEEQFAEDILLLKSVGLCPIIVHGGGPEISQTLEKLGLKSHFIDGLRVTDIDAMEVVEMVLSGKVNQRLVAAINVHSDQGIGLSGKDGSLLRAKAYQKTPNLGRVGEVHTVNTQIIEMLLDDNRIPIISPVGLGSDGIAYNINADVVAAELASALNAAKLIFMSDVPGFLEQGKVVPEMTGDQLKDRIERGEVTGGMLPKLQASLKSLKSGVKKVHLVDGRVPHNLISELFTDRGVGTLIRKS